MKEFHLLVSILLFSQFYLFINSIVSESQTILHLKWLIFITITHVKFLLYLTSYETLFLAFFTVAIPSWTENFIEKYFISDFLFFSGISMFEEDDVWGYWNCPSWKILRKEKPFCSSRSRTLSFCSNYEIRTSWKELDIFSSIYWDLLPPYHIFQVQNKTAFHELRPLKSFV